MNPRKLLAIVAASAALAIAALAPGIASAEVPSDEVPAGLQAAIKADVASRGKQYAGFCRDLPQGGNYAGQWCVFVQELDGDAATVTMGPWATDEITEVTFVRGNGDTWALKGATPPADGLPGGLSDAIKKAVEDRGHAYIGYCQQVPPGADAIGKWCATVKEFTPASAMVAIGAHATDQLTWLTFTKTGDMWSSQQVQAPSNGGPGTPSTPKPPSTGSGTSDESDAGYGMAVGPLTVVTLAVIGGIAVVRASRSNRR